MGDVELFIENDGYKNEPWVVGEVSWTLERVGTPGRLEFSTLKDKEFSFFEGSKVTLRVKGKGLFMGYIFSKDRDKDGVIRIVAYDQLRYLKNKDSYIFSEVTVSDIVRSITGDFNLVCGDIEDSGHVIGERIEDNKSLFDIILNAIDETFKATGELFVLYDDFGKICLKNVKNMKVDYLIEGGGAENFSYKSSIDGDTYNQIKLIYEDGRKGERKVYMKNDAASIESFGVLQYFDKIDEEVNGDEEAKALLKSYNRKERILSINKAFGDINVRGGSEICVNLNLGDIDGSMLMRVESVTHTFGINEHYMDLTVKGGLFE